MSFRDRAISLPKRFKYLRQKFWRYSFAGIANDNSSLGLNALYCDLHAPALRSELHCVGQEIPKNLLQPVFISNNSNRRSVPHHLELYTFSFKRWMDRVYRRLDHRYELNRFDIEPQLARNDTRHIQ